MRKLTEDQLEKFNQYVKDVNKYGSFEEANDYWQGRFKGIPDWDSLSGSKSCPSFDFNYYDEYRRKPETVTVTYPKPLSEKPIFNDLYFYRLPSSNTGYSAFRWKDDDQDNLRLVNGQLYGSEEDMKEVVRIDRSMVNNDE